MGQCNWFVFVDLKLSVTRKEELAFLEFLSCKIY